MPNDTVIDDSEHESTVTSLSDDDPPPPPPPQPPQGFDNPPSPSTPFSSKESHGSSAEQEETIIKGRGRPRKDGLPNKTATLGPQHTPTHMYRKFYSDANNANQKPQAFLRWYWSADLPTWVRERLTVYVYRTWPVLKAVEEGEDGKKVDVKYIDKPPMPKDINELEDRYGAGDYHLMINDDLVDKRTIAELFVREGYRDFTRKPPTDRRIDNVENVDLDEPTNKSYVAYLRGKGRLPEQQQAKGREADMAEASAVKEMTSLVRDIIASKKDDRGTNDTTATVVKEIMGVMGEVNKQASSVMENAYKKTQQEAHAPAPQVNPIETMREMFALVREMKPEASGDSETIKLLLSQMNEDRKRFEELIKEIRGGGQTNPQAQANPLSTTSDTIKTVVELVTTLGFKAPGAAAASVIGSETGSWWKDNLPEIMQYGSQAVSAIAQAFTTKMQIDARTAQQYQTQPQPMYQPQPQTQPQAQTLPPGVDPTIIQPDPVPVPEMTTEQQAELQDFYQFMGFIHEPLMNHIDQALGGDRFAEWLIDSKRDGAARYQQIKMAGPENLMAGLKMYQPLWMELEPKQGLLPQFIEEFMTMEETRAREEAESMEEEEEETAAGD